MVWGREEYRVLFLVVGHYVEALENKQKAYVIYTDFAKAFDKCNLIVIARKIHKIKISGKMGRL